MKAATVFETIRENITGYNMNTEMHNEGPVQGITSMYQNLGEDHIFMLKASKNSAKYLQEAILRKPALIITDFEKDAFIDFHDEVAICYIDDFAEVSIRLVELFYGEHIGRMKYIAVTGTNGKTTTSHFIGRLLSELGYKVATIGTLGVFDGAYEKVDFAHTTPTTPMHFEFAEIIKYFSTREYDYIVYEATSIALDQGRTGFIRNNLAVFINFSPEHLDYHRTMTRYLESKLSLADLSEETLVNMDAPEYRVLAKDRYHFSKHEDTYYRYRTDVDHIDIHVEDVDYVVRPGFLGEHNYINLATGIFALLKLGHDVEAVIRAADVITPPIHRFELFTEGNYEFILDFAHTPVAIKESIINAMKYAEKMEKKLIVMVTGIGMRGYRKIRMTMKLVPEGLHHLVLAAEQIGYEDEEKIVGMMQKHLPASYDDSNTTTALSRQEGIIRAIGHAGPDTIILLTGINEPQHYRGDVIAHDDRQFILQYLED